MLKTHQRFKSERHNAFTEVITKIALSSNDDKRMQSIGSIETYACRMSKYIIYVKEKAKRYNILQRCLTSIMLPKKT